MGIRIAFALISVLSFFSSSAQSTMKVVDLKCEYLVSPLGIDATNPRFTYILKDDRAGAKQTAYQIIVGTDSAAVVKGAGNNWSSAKINSSSQLIVYAGKALQPFTRYFWKIRSWDKDSKIAVSPITSFETGMMNSSNWKGSWINDTRNIHLKPAPYFRKAFETKKVIRSARAYIAAAGLYELYINGKQIGDHRLDPTYTRFDRRNLYITYDITAEMNQGKNAVGVLLGNGWYNHQSTAVWYFHEAPWRARPSFCLNIRINYEDGTTETIATGKDWKTALSPVIFNSIYTAEHYDANKEIPHWNEPDFIDTSWKPVNYCAAPSNQIVAQNLHPIRNVERIEPISVKKFSDTVYVFDLGRNISGVSEIRIKAAPGTVVRLKHGERIYENGRVDISNIDPHYRPTDDKDPFQTDIFIPKGNGVEESFMPRFNYKGFQYVEVTSNKPVNLDKQNLTGYFMHSDVPPIGQLQSSSELINKIWWATNNSYLSNLFGYPTDCPQREKNGWTGDAQIAIETGLYSFDAITVYEKWLADHRDEQQPNGVLPSIIPSSGWGYEWGNGPDWTSTIAIIPWNIYLFYGDSKLLRDCYDNIRRYVDHIDEEYPSGLTTWGLGDWIPVKSKSPVELTSTCYYYADALILSKAAALFGKTSDQQKYQRLAEKIKKAFNDKYLHKEKGIYNNGLQTELSVPLLWGLVPEDMKSKVADNLAKRVAADGNSLDVGLLGTKAILNALSENGHAALAYKLASNDKYPSWGWWIVNGATTLYENWPIDAKSDISMNHIMFGEIGAWLYKALGGIKPDPSAPGFKNILVQPYFVDELNSFTASHQSPYGLIESSWKKENGKTIYSLIVPANSTATLVLSTNDGKIFKGGMAQTSVAGQYTINLIAGKHEFEIRK